MAVGTGVGRPPVPRSFIDSTLPSLAMGETAPRFSSTSCALVRGVSRRIWLRDLRMRRTAVRDPGVYGAAGGAGDVSGQGCGGTGEWRERGTAAEAGGGVRMCPGA